MTFVKFVKYKCREKSQLYGTIICLCSANVLISADWSAKLGDFGVSRCIPSEATSLMTTTIVGTDIFMAPEYRTGTVSTATDVYAFGVVREMK